MLEIGLSLIGGLVLFLYAVSSLSDTVKDWAGDKAREFISRFTKNVFTAIISGLIATVILDSSSAVIILTIVLINAGTLSFKQAIGIVMGANIGTTISSQIIAMDIGKYYAYSATARACDAVYQPQSEDQSNRENSALFRNAFFRALYDGKCR